MNATKKTTPADETPQETAPTPRRTRTGVLAAMDRGAALKQVVEAQQANIKGKSPLAAFQPYQPSPESSTPDTALEVAKLSGRDIRQLELRKIHANPFQPREVYTPAIVRERAESIKINGQAELIHVIPHPDIPGEFMIGDGWTRTTGCLEYEVVDTLLGEVHHDLTPMEAAWLGYRSNEEREQFCDFDKACFYDKLYAEGTSQREVSRRTGISQAKLSFFASFKKLPAEVLDIVRANPQKFTAFIIPNLAKVADKVSVAKATSLALSFATGEMTTSQFTRQCAALLDKGKTPTSAPSKSGKVVRYQNGTLRQKGSKFDLSVEVDEDVREQFYAELEELLKNYTSSAAEENVK